MRLQFLILCVCLWATGQIMEIKDLASNPRGDKTTGTFLIQQMGIFQLPFFREIAEVPTDNYSFGDNQKILFLCQYANGIKNGPEVCWHPPRLLYTANYANGVLEGIVCVYPEQTAYYSFTVEKGELNGPCRATFIPFRFAQCKLLNTFDWNAALEEQKEKTGPPDYTVVTEGEYRDGKKFSGEFLTIKHDGAFLKVHISKYANGIETERSDEKIYKQNGYIVEW